MFNRIAAREIGQGAAQPIDLSAFRRRPSRSSTIGLFCLGCKHVFETDHESVKVGLVTCNECGECRSLTTLERQLLAVDR